MKKIAWVTSDCFIDCDFDFNLLEEILKHYDIDWYLLLPLENALYDKFDFSKFSKLNNLKISLVKSEYSSGDIRRISFYKELYQKLVRSKADIYYINCPPTPFLVPLVYLLDRKKTIVTAHQGEVHKGFRNPYKHKLVRKLLYSRVKFVNMFSPSQAKLFSRYFPSVNVRVILLALKSFGEPEEGYSKHQTKVNFLVFGHINYGKNIDLLIEAACNLYERGIRNFIISINGMCNNWTYYEEKIRYPEIFHCDIRLIDNNEIPNLFSSAHFLVQPYRIVTQSGPLKIAFNYNLPVICSNFPGFSDEVKEEINGLLFEPQNVKSLEKKMLQAIEIVDTGDYQIFCDNMKCFNEKLYTPSVLAREYVNMFNEL